MHFTERYRVNGDKIETVKDVTKIIDALDIRLAPDNDHFEELEPYLTEVDEDDHHATYD